MTFNFTGKTALVTGAASGIGFATAQALALGGVARLIVTDRVVGGLDALDALPCPIVKLIGDGNSLCSIESSVRGVGTPCKSSAECSTGYCDTGVSPAECADVPKTCANDCAGHGSCEFREYFGAVPDVQVASCLSLDNNCYASCACDEGYGGSGCQYTNSTLQESRFVVSQMCAGLSGLKSTQDYSFEVAMTRAVSIAQLLLDPSLVSSTAFRQCSLTLTATVLRNPIAAAGDSSMAIMVSAFTKVLGKGALPATSSPAVRAGLHRRRRSQT